MPPKTVIFDFGNVIARFDNSRFLAALLQLPHKDCLPWTRKIFVESTISKEFETGKIPLSQFQGEIERILGRSFSEEAFTRAYCEIFEPISETGELLDFLSGKCRVGLLSNTNPLHFQRVIREIPFFPKFDQVTLSFEVGYMKPAPAIFADAIQKANCPAADILYLDDIPEYVKGAQDCGLTALVFDKPGILSQKIKAFIDGHG